MKLKDTDILDLPKSKEINSEPPQMSFAEMFAACEKMLPTWNEKRFKKALEATFDKFEL